MRKIAWVIIGWLALAVCVPADPPAAVRKAHADKNKDGVVTPREVKQERRWETKQKSVVNTPWEAKADVNQDGHVGPKEAATARRSLYIRELSVADRPWEKKADANADGRVDLKELRIYHVSQLDANQDGRITVVERRAYWVQKRSVVNTALEKKYDTNGDGYLSWDEGRELLKDRLTVIKTDGQAIVNTDLEMEFDANGDGIIDRKEAPAVQQALEE